MKKKNNNNNNNDGFDTPFFWQYWKKTVLEDLDELRNHIIDIRCEQARIAVEQEEIELRIKHLQNLIEQEKHLQKLHIIDVRMLEGEEEDD